MAKLVVHVGGLLVLARLLSPSDFGLVGMVVAVVGVAEVFLDFGLLAAAVQAPELSEKQRNALFWVNSLIGAVLAIVVALVAGQIAAFYDRAEVEPLTQVFAITFLLAGMATQYRADLTRRMRFERFALADIGGLLLGLVVAVVLAAGGAGPWALVGQQIAYRGGVLVLAAAFSGWLPSLDADWRGLRGLLRFGTNLTGIQVVTHLSRNIDSLMVGRQFGAAALGVYNRAFQILMLPLNQLSFPSTTVALPVLSSLRGRRAEFDAYLLRGQLVMAHLAVVVLAVGVVTAGEVIPLALGDQWVEVVEVFRILAVGGMFHIVSHANAWVVLADDLTGAAFRFQLVARSLMSMGVVAASFVSVEAVAIAYSAGLAAYWPVELRWLSSRSAAPSGTMFRNGMRAITAYSIAAGAGLVAVELVGDGPVAVSLLAGISVMGVALLALRAVWRAFGADTRTVLGSLREVLRRRFAPGPGSAEPAAPAG